MDLNGGRRPTPLIETPRRPPWMLIVLLIAGLAVIAWGVSNMSFSARETDAPVEPRPAGRDELIPVAPEARPLTTVDRDVVLPVAPVSSAPGPKWASQPVVEYPHAGDRAPGGVGRVVLSCQVAADRSLESCRIVSETPDGYGFGRNALAGAREARVSPDTPVGVRVQFAVRFIQPN
jgi:protein TonB